VDWSFLTVNDTFTTFITQVVVPRVVETLKGALRVQPIVGNLLLHQQYVATSLCSVLLLTYVFSPYQKLGVLVTTPTPTSVSNIIPPGARISSSRTATSRKRTGPGFQIRTLSSTRNPSPSGETRGQWLPRASLTLMEGRSAVMLILGPCMM
jgi:hypothetical protein